MAPSLQGKVAIVTGGSRELGRAGAAGAALHAVEADVRDHPAVESLVEAAVR